MATDSDDPVSLPKPPPPRPAARDAAIEAAMRRFDGGEPETSARARQSWIAWLPKDRRAVGALATAAVIAIVSVPVAFTALRDNPRPIAPQTPQAPTEAQADQIAPTVADPASAQAKESVAAPAPMAAEPPATRSRSSLPALVAAPDQRATSVEEMAKAIQAEPAPAAAPPPPPPPPPAPARSEQFAADAQEMVVTGSRIPRPDLQKPSNVSVMAERSAEPASPAAGSDVYGQFLSRLQAAVRAKNKAAVVRLVDLPLRVNFAGGARTYRDRGSIQRDFDRIFTPRVTRAILDQQADRLFINYQGAMIGDGQVWFDRTCPNASCSPAGPVRIRSINP